MQCLYTRPDYGGQWQTTLPKVDVPIRPAMEISHFMELTRGLRRYTHAPVDPRVDLDARVSTVGINCPAALQSGNYHTYTQTSCVARARGIDTRETDVCGCV